MVPSMKRRPPEHALLGAQRSEQREKELHHAARLERTVREVAMVTGRDTKHTRIERHGAEQEPLPRDYNEHDADNGSYVQAEERNRDQSDPSFTPFSG